MKSKTLYIDLDDVLSATAEAYVHLIKLLFNKTVFVDDIHSFDLQVSFMLTDQQYNHMFEEAHCREFTMGLSPHPYANEILTSWRKSGYSIAIVTGRHTQTYGDTKDWLSCHSFPYDHLIMVDKYGREDTDKSIAIPLSELSKRTFHLAIEDNSEMAQYLSMEMNTPVMLFNRPWNRKVKENPFITRCQSWLEIARTVDKFL